MSALSDYRNFTRQAAGFDGATAETAVYTQLRHVFSTTATGTVGRFSPASLNRYNIVSIVRVMLQGVLAPGDEIRVRDSSGGIRFTRPASIESSGWFFMGPEDTLEILAPDATSADVLVNDLTDEQLQEWVYSEGQGGIIPIGQSSITIVASQVVPIFSGHLIAFIDSPLAATVTLPALADIPLDSKVTFIRVANVGLPTIVVGDALDEVNGRVGALGTDYNLRSIGDAVTYLRVPQGWTRAFGDQVQPELISAATPLQVPSFQGGALYVTSLAANTGHLIRLGALAEYREGCRIVIHTVDGSTQNTIAPAGGELINGLADLPVPPRATVMVEQAGSQWLAVISNPQNVQQIVVPGQIDPVVGRVVVIVSLVGDGDVSLPPLADTPVGSEILFIRQDAIGNGTPRIITDNIADEVNGRPSGAGFVNTQYFLRSNADSITFVRVPLGWAVKMGEQAPAEIFDSADPIIVPPWAGGTLYLRDGGIVAGNVTQLPALTEVREGCRLKILANSVNPGVHVLTTAGGDTINGEPGPLLYAVGRPGFFGDQPNRPVVTVEHAGTTWNVVVDQPSQMINVFAAGTLPTLGGPVFVNLELIADGDITLPTIIDVPLGTEYILTRRGGAGVPRITPGALTFVNGVAGDITTEYFLRSRGDSVSYRKGSGGWTRPFGDQAPPAVTSAANPIDIRPWTGGSAYVIDTHPGVALITLPPTQDSKTGCRVVVRNTDTRQHLVTPELGETINGTTAWFIQPGQVASFEVVEAGTWFAMGGGNQRQPIISAVDVVLPSFAGEQYVTMTAGGSTLTLPDYTEIAVGTKVFILNTAGGGNLTVAAFAGQLVLGAPSQPVPFSTGYVAFWGGNAAVGWQGFVTP